MGGRGSSFQHRGRSREPERFESFQDEPRDGFEYEGDGSEQEKWFKDNSNFKELIDQMSNDDVDAFMWGWVSGMFMFGQQYKGWDGMHDMDKTYTQVFDDVLDKAVLKKGVTVVRLTTAEVFFGKGVKTASLDELRGLEGKTIISPGNMSTAAAAKGLTINAKGPNTKHHELKINIPGGTVGAGMWIGDERINSFGPKQREFMMNRDILLNVGKTTYDASRDVYVTEVTYAGRMKHDYGKSGRV